MRIRRVKVPSVRVRLNLSNDLRHRINGLIEGTSQTTQAFMVDAIDRAVQRAELHTAMAEEHQRRHRKPR